MQVKRFLLSELPDLGRGRVFFRIPFPRPKPPRLESSTSRDVFSAERGDTTRNVDFIQRASPACFFPSRAKLMRLFTAQLIEPLVLAHCIELLLQLARSVECGK
ncbi:hypothetical protein AVEN_88971-1 [Araneus ventricosus]|uniref:Uncharacterized protein n=1 Tax=Araneus ventricosus TaxID=182803 RepID=A0A4Y2DKC4_ARAVE|nr:hypothetical protein AVEN_88971-1 [Araneus ventricosus]